MLSPLRQMYTSATADEEKKNIVLCLYMVYIIASQQALCGGMVDTKRTGAIRLLGLWETMIRATDCKSKFILSMSKPDTFLNKLNKEEIKEMANHGQSRSAIIVFNLAKNISRYNEDISYRALYGACSDAFGQIIPIQYRDNFVAFVACSLSVHQRHGITDNRLETLKNQLALSFAEAGLDSPPPPQLTAMSPALELVADRSPRNIQWGKAGQAVRGT
jgi:hypothetical protein